MIVVRVFGRVLIAIALALLLLGLALWLSGADIAQPAGRLWFELHSNSLNAAQVIIQRHLHLPGFWDDAIVPGLLLRPAWESILWLFIGFFALGGILASLGKGERKRRTFR